MKISTLSLKAAKLFFCVQLRKIVSATGFVFLLLIGGVSKSWGQLFWNTDGVSESWGAANWSSTGSAPFTSAWVDGSNVIFSATSAITYVTGRPVGNISVTGSASTVTISAAGTMPAGAHTIDVSSGSSLVWGSQSVTAAGTSFIKNNSGTWNIGSIGNAYTGGFTLNAGTILVTGNNSMGAAALTINGGTIQSSLNSTYGVTAITIGGDFTLTGTGNPTYLANVSLGGFTRTITNSATGVTRTFSGIISGGSSGVGLTVAGTGTTILSGANTYTGLTTVSGGTLQLNRTGGATIPVTNNVTVNGGTLRVSSNLTINDLVVSSGTLTVDPGVTLTINGTFTGGGTITNNGKIILVGPSTFPGATTTVSAFNDLEINRSSGVSLDKSLAIAGTLTLTSGALSIGSNTLTLNGSVSGSGTLTGTASAGTSTSNLVIGGAAGTLNFTQTSAATRSLNNLTLNTGGSATLGNALDVYGTIALTSATLHLDAKNLTLKSNSTNTARIADLTGSTLDGATNVTMERWIKLRTGGTGRAYRLLAPTVNTPGSSTIQANWMEGGMNTSIGVNINPVPGFGTQITGAGGNTNGFDVTASNAPSLYSATNAVTPTYTAIGNIGTGSSLNALTGYMLYVRGDRSMDMTLPLAMGMPTSSTTLRTTGALVIGTQTTFTNTLIGGGALNLITNPFASPIDWSLVQPACTNVSTSYTLWDANFGTRGGFVTVNTSGIASAGLATKFIQPGQAFFVQASGGVPTVSIQEGHKSAGNNDDVFRLTTAVESFKTELYFTEPNGYRRAADGVIAIYDNSYSPGIDADDALEINNWDENIALARESKRLAIESRPVILTKDTLYLFMNNMKQQVYEFEFKPSLFTNGALKAELIDNFTGTRALLSVLTNTVVPFTVTANPASSASDRFKVVFGPSVVLAVDLITTKAYKKNQGVQVDWTARTESDMDHYEVERSATGSNFDRKTIVAALGNSNGAVNYSWFDANPERGNNFYRVKGVDKTGNVRYSTIVKVTVGENEPGIIIYPNPVTGNSFTIELNNLIKGVYRVSLINNLGQQVLRTNIQHEGGSVTKTITMTQTVKKGTYQLVLRTENGSGNNPINLTQQLIKN